MAINIHCLKSVRKSLYSVLMRENTDQKNSEYGHFSRSNCSCYTDEVYETGKLVRANATTKYCSGFRYSVKFIFEGYCINWKKQINKFFNKNFNICVVDNSLVIVFNPLINTSYLCVYYSVSRSWWCLYFILVMWTIRIQFADYIEGYLSPHFYLFLTWDL